MFVKRLLLPSMQLNKCSILSHLMFWSTFSLVQPHFDYCKVVWGHCKKGLSEKLQRLSKSHSPSASYDSNLDDVLRVLGCHKLSHQRLEKKSIMKFKTGLHGTLEYLRTRFVYRDNVKHLLFGGTP